MFLVFIKILFYQLKVCIIKEFYGQIKNNHTKSYTMKNTWLYFTAEILATKARIYI